MTPKQNPPPPTKQPVRLTLPGVENDLGIALRDTTHQPMVDVGIPQSELPPRHHPWYQRLWLKFLG